MVIEDLALTFLPGIGIKGTVHLLEVFGNAASVFAATEDELRARTRLRESQIAAIVQRRSFAEAEKEHKYCHKHGIQPIASTDPLYPSLLREIPDYPAVIYLLGNPEALSLRTLSVVGTRRASNYGVTVCHDWIMQLAREIENLCIVSGLAFGIDVTAHRAALAAGIPTVGVLANALPEVMPPAHTRIAQDMLDHGGALITEFSSQSRQKGFGYLARNRIIAALSRCTWIVEAPEKSGALNTAHTAHSYNRTVVALPGRVTDPNARGTLTLIRNGVALPLVSPEDIRREMIDDPQIGNLGRSTTRTNRPSVATDAAATDIAAQDPAMTDPAALDTATLDSAATPSVQPFVAQVSPLDELSPLERQLFVYLPDSDPISMQELADQSGFDIGTLTSILGTLEILGFVQHLPGNRYLKNHSV